MINMKFLLPQLQDFDEDTLFQQDEITAHTTRAFKEVVRKLFSEKVISRFGEQSISYVALFPSGG